MASSNSKETRKAREKFIYEEKMYTFNTKCGVNQYFRCVNRSCPARLIKKKSCVLVTKPHNCSIGSVECDVERARMLLRRRAQNDFDSSPQEIVAEVKAKFSPVVQKAMSRDDVLWGYVRRYRRDAEEEALIRQENQKNSEENNGTRVVKLEESRSFSEANQSNEDYNDNFEPMESFDNHDDSTSPSNVNQTEDVDIKPDPESLNLGPDNRKESGLGLASELTSPPITVTVQRAPPSKYKSTTNDNPCLICFSESGDTGRNSASPTKLVNSNLMIIFLMKKMLEVRSDELINLMEESEWKHPTEWVYLCNACHRIVEEALGVNNQIVKLERRMTMFKLDILEKIKKSAGTSNQSESIHNSITHKLRTQTGERVDPQADYEKIHCSIASRVRKQASSVPQPQIKTLPLIITATTTVCTSTSTPSDVQVEDETNADPDWNEGEDDYHHEVVDVSSDSENERPQRKRRRTRWSSSSRRMKSKATPEKSNMPTEETPMYTCATCPSLPGMVFDAFLQHLIFHWKRPNRCTRCPMYLPMVPTLIKRHWEDMHGGKESDHLSKFSEVDFSPGNLWECDKCAEKFPTFMDRDRHELEEHKLVIPKQEICSVCSECFRTKNEIRLHKALTHPFEASMNCCFCDESFPNTSVEGVQYVDGDEMRKHIREKHTSFRPGYRQRFRTFRNLRLKTHGYVRNYLHTCPFCGLITNESAFSKLQKHLVEEHRISDIKKAFTCPVCHKDKYPIHFTKHIKVSHGSKMVCETCGEEIRPVSYPLHAFQNHGIILDGYKLEECTMEGCNYKTFEKRLLARHMLVRHEPKKNLLPCQYCGKGFGTPLCLKRHETLHVNAKTKPFQCDICGNSFADRNYLYTHRKYTHKVNVAPNQLAKVKLQRRMQKQRRKQRRNAAKYSNITQSNEPGSS